MSSLSPTDQATKLRTITAAAAGVVALAAATLCFIGVAEGALMEFARTRVDPTRLIPLFAALGLAGAGAGLAAAAFFAPTRARALLVAGFIGCALAIAATSRIAAEPWMLVGAGATGACLGWTVVVLALCLRPTFHLRRLGLGCGLGVGLGHALAQQLAVFEAAPRTELLAIAGVALAGAVAGFWVRAEHPKSSNAPEYTWRVASTWIVVLALLAALNALAVHLLRQHPASHLQSWDSALVLQANALIHVCAAVVAGISLDRRWAGTAGLVALGLLLGACWLYGALMQNFPQARVLHVAGASVASTVFIHLLARSGHRWFVGALWGLCGWTGSIVALAFALHLQPQRVSSSLLLAAAGLAAGASIARAVWLRRARDQ